MISVIVIFLSFVYFVDKREDNILQKDNHFDKAEKASFEETREERLDIFSEVWSQNSPAGKGYEFKVNCGQNYSSLETCYLWNIENVSVTTPESVRYFLGKDFNVNNYSGEITRRWVLYGPENSTLPVSGIYRFEFTKEKSVVFVDFVNYTRSAIDYPKEVKWEKRGSDLFVNWIPPSGVGKEMWYKVILWNEAGTPQNFVSLSFPWNVKEGTLKNVLFVNGGNYSLNVAVFYRGGYAYSEYVKVQW